MVQKNLFPYFGGKSQIAPQVWSYLSNIKNYVEPFCGSAAVLFQRPPNIKCTETINDIDGLLVNCYRAIKYDYEQVAHYADWPVSELDIEARHHAICKFYGQNNFINKMRVDETFYDAKIAGYWIYGQCTWLGNGWCSDKLLKKYADGNVPDVVKKIAQGEDIDGREAYGQLPHLGDAGKGLNREAYGKLPHLGNAGMENYGKLPHLGDAGKGLNREDYGRLPHLGGGKGLNREHYGKLPHLGGGKGLNREAYGKLPHLGDAGMGLNREAYGKLPHLGNAGMGPHLGNAGMGLNRGKQSDYIYNILSDYCNRLRNVRIVCGDWRRVLTPSVTTHHGLTGVFFDPPYSTANTDWDNSYSYRDSKEQETAIWDDAAKWCVDNQDNKDFVIVLCGQEGDFTPPDKRWKTVEWSRRSGYSQEDKDDKDARHMERMWICNSHKKVCENYSLFKEE